jgi:hypothetical protein
MYGILLDTWLVVTRWTYSPKPGRTVNVRRGNPIFTKRPIALFSLFKSCFSGIMTNRRFSIDLENPDLLEFLKTLIDLGEF